MSFAAGVFSLAAGNPVVSGSTIQSAWANSTLSDIATGLSTCILKDGTQTITANIPMGGFKFTGLAAGSANGNSIRFEQTLIGLATTKGDLLAATTANAVARLGVGVNGTVLVADSSQTTGLNYMVAPIPLTGAAGTNTVTATAAPIPAAYATNQTYILTPAVTNTAATTLNISTIGAKNVFSGGAACSGNELVANVPVLIQYDGTQFNIIGPMIGTRVTNSLSGDVALNNTANFFDGPSTAQGTVGTWLASGTVTLLDTGGAAAYVVKLWDGTTIISSGAGFSAVGSSTTISLSGYITSPAGNIRISVKDVTAVTGKIIFNTTGLSKDSTIIATRIG